MIPALPLNYFDAIGFEPLREYTEQAFETPPEIPLREYPPLRAPDLCPDDTQDAPPSGYHPGGVRPEGCHWPECFTDKDAAEWDADWQNAT